MRTSFIAAATLALSVPAIGQVPVAEFRIVERHTTPITTVTGTGNNVLNYAVQARVTGAANVGLSQCSFNIVMPGESPSNGVLALNTINNADGSYWSGAISSTSTTLNKVAGVTYAYRYLIGINPTFNGLINSSGGSWTNNPSTNSIGLVTLSSAGMNYLLYVDPQGNGFPDSPLNPATQLNPWFGANGNWIDIYRFQYTVTNLDTNRSVSVNLDLDTSTVRVFSSSQLNSGLWGPASVVPSSVNAAGTSFSINVIGACCDNLSAVCSLTSQGLCIGGTFQGIGTACSPSPCPGGACCNPATGNCTFATSLGCGSPQTFQGLGTTCSPNPCPQPGTCCAATGACTFSLQSACAFGSAWTQGGACSPNPCPQRGTCCASTGACSFVLQSTCTGGSVWTLGGTCSPNTCPQPGTCCASTGVCSFGFQSSCTGGSVWTLGGTCSPNTCPQPGTCCASTGACSFVLQSICTGGAVWTQSGVCSPNTCPQPGTCCASTGACSFVLQSVCTSGAVWTQGGACSPNPCPQPGTCCAGTGVCTFGFQSACTGSSVWTQGGACSPNPCPQPGTCCAPTGACTFSLQSVCVSGSVWTQGGVCSPNPCPQPGTCCSSTGVCTFSLQSVCVSGSVWTQGGACSPNPCPQPGVCCPTSGICSIILQTTCSGAWSQTGSCSPNPCPQPTVEFRIVERHPSPVGTVVAGSNVLNYSVQARVVSVPNAGVASCGFHIEMPGEVEANGVLALNTVSNLDGTYWTGAIDSTSTAGGQLVGMPYAYRYLVGINGQFNGLINSSSGAWVNNPSQQDIGLITLYSANTNYLRYADPQGNGVPDSPLNAATQLNPWFGANGNWIDIYRFQYTVTNLSVDRTVQVNLVMDSAAQVFSTSRNMSGLWAPFQVPAVETRISGASFTVVYLGACCSSTTAQCTITAPAACSGGTFQGSGTACTPTLCPGGACCTPANGACAFTGPSGCALPLIYRGTGTTCQASSCPTGSCCGTDGSCAATMQAGCAAVWTAAGVCSPNPCPQPGTCCAATGICTFQLQSSCSGPSVWTQGGACSPNPCPQPGACCASNGACAVSLQSACSTQWIQGSTCAINPCPQPGRCCASNGVCGLVLQTSCIGNWSQGGSCTPNTCPQPGTCCATSGACTFVLQSTCSGGSVWMNAGACSPNPCPQPGSCCTPSGTCASTFQVSCTGLWTLGRACSPNPCTPPHTVVVRTVRAAGPTGIAPWSTAVTSLQTALAASLPGDEIWIASGSYSPATPTSSNSGVTFAIPSGVRVYGGFAGSETARDQRNSDPTVHETVLTGLDWFNRVVTISSAGLDIVLDGLTISHGRGAAWNQFPDTEWEGAGMLITSSNSVLISKCTFSFNVSGQSPFAVGFPSQGSRGGRGGGVLVLSSACKFQSCRFSNNACSYGQSVGCVAGTTGPAGAGGSGGAVSLQGSVAAFTDCQFTTNNAGAGAGGSGCGIQVGAGGAGGSGGAVYAESCTSTFSRCTFSSNRAGDGGRGGTNSGPAAPNGVGGSGGALRIAGGSASVTSCVFLSNVAGSATPTSSGLGAAGASGGSGGAVHASATQITLLNSILATNIAGNGGAGGIDSGFECARAGGDAGTGGGLALTGGSTASVIACTITQNVPGSPGSGAGASPPNCPVPGPAGASGVGGIASDAFVTVTDSILWNNSSGQIAAPTSSVLFSCVQGGAPGTGNLSVDPQFVNPGLSNYRLSSASSCIDAASNVPFPASLVADVAGNPRFVNVCGILPDTGPMPPADMGAYEYQGSGLDCNLDGVCDLREVTGIQVLQAPVPLVNDRFGWKASLYGDSVLIGARGTDTSAGIGSGAAYIYSRQGALWGDAQTLIPLDAAAGDDFGNWTALSDRWAFVGARFAQAGGSPGAGAAYVYQPGPAGWVQSGKLLAPDPVFNAEFGHGIAIDKNRVVIGALHATSSGVNDCGAAYVYLYNGAGWALETKLVPADPTPGKGFGLSVSISGDTIVVGAPYDGNAAAQGGGAYVFQRFTNGWVQVAKVLPTESASLVDANFAELVAISGDLFIANAPRLTHHGQFRAGAAYVFRRVGSAWIQEGRLTSDLPLADEWFGYDIAIEGNQAMIGGFRRTISGQPGAGSAYVYRRFGTTWLMASRIDSPDPHPVGYFGYGIGMQGTRAVLGEFRAQWGNDSFSGVARAFDLSLLDGNHDGIPDSCQIASGTLPDTDHNGIPDNVQFNPCRADFNNSGFITVQDIFDFLNAWFSGAPSGDFNGISGLTVQDIFDFLNAWFAGCS